MNSCCIIVPCYNEEKRLPIIDFENFISNNENFILLFVNDGSSDNTQEVIDSLAKKNPEKIFSYKLEKNSGKAEAVRQGFIYAIENINSDYFSYLDADLATPLIEIKRLHSIINKNPNWQLIFGSRFKRLGVTINRKIYRHYLGRVIATFISMILKLPIYDTQCGAKIFSKELASSLFQLEFISRWLFDVEIFARIIKQKGREAIYNIAFEEPLQEWVEVSGSKINFLDMIKIPIELIRIKFKYKI
ncbi:MAG TPA: glycosyltransferase family 2 protein [Bacteroidales bacterium]|nr:glycosyltransferase family 2 protein [Bacteroidales bacterium]HPS16818.1 glycosyltransferase family 2 protein [Bacteroidales bacterium]